MGSDLEDCAEDGENTLTLGVVSLLNDADSELILPC